MNPATINQYPADSIDSIYLRAARNFIMRDICPGKLLNVGIGYGVWDEILSDYGTSVISLDISEALVAQFQERFPKTQYVCTDVFEYQPQERFDTIIGSHILEHIGDPPALLRLWGSWLRPGGRILAVVPNAESAHRHLGVKMGLLAQLTDLNDGDIQVGHKRVYTMESFRADLEKTNMKIMRFGGITFKPLSNSQLAAMPASYVDACCSLSDEIGRLAGQIYAVLETENTHVS